VAGRLGYGATGHKIVAYSNVASVAYPKFEDYGTYRRLDSVGIPSLHG
jgi:hypothetical protein